MTKLSKVVVIISFAIMAAAGYGAFRFFKFSFSLKEKAEIAVDLLGSAEISKVKVSIGEIEGIAGVTFISKEEAMKAFRREMGDDASAFNNVLPSNPLPNSFIVTLKGMYATPEAFERVSSRLMSIEGVDDVGYEKRFIERVFYFIGLGERIVLIGGIVLLAYTGIVILTIFRANRDKRKVWKTF